MDLQELLVRTQRAHPNVSLDDNDSWDIPAYSPYGGVWEMYSPLHKKLEIQWDFERFLLDSLKTGKISGIKEIASYFQGYREKWGINTQYKKDQKGQDLILAQLFLEQHGGNIWWLLRNDSSDSNQNNSSVCTSSCTNNRVAMWFDHAPEWLRVVICNVLMYVIWLVPPILFLILANFTATFKNFPCDLLALALGFAALCWLVLPFKL